MTESRDIPALLKGPLVVKFLAGEKTVTRRTDLAKWKNAKPGDRIWFRETYRLPGGWVGYEGGKCLVRELSVSYRADGVRIDWPVSKETWDDDLAKGIRESDRLKEQGKDIGLIYSRWRPSIFMPKWAARCWAVVEDIHEEPLQAITYDDIRLEGIRCPEHDFASGFCVGSCLALGNEWVRTWDSINGKKPGLSWKDNPTVARIKFRRIEAPK